VQHLAQSRGGKIGRSHERYFRRVEQKPWERSRAAGASTF
jgi:hypothetical protein